MARGLLGLARRPPIRPAAGRAGDGCGGLPPRPDSFAPSRCSGWHRQERRWASSSCRVSGCWWGGDSAPARFLDRHPARASPLAGVAVVAVGRRRPAGPDPRPVDHRRDDRALRQRGWRRRAYAFADGHGSVFAAFSHSVDFSRALPSLFRQGETATVALMQAVVWLVATAAAAWLVAANAGAFGRRRRDRAGWTDAAGGCRDRRVRGLAGGRRRDPWTPGAAALAVAAGRRQRGVAGIGIEHACVPAGCDGLIAGLRLRTPESVPLQPPVLLHVPDLPAGDYDVRARARWAAPAALQVELGREAWPFATWALGDAAAVVQSADGPAFRAGARHPSCRGPRCGSSPSAPRGAPRAPA